MAKDTVVKKRVPKKIKASYPEEIAPMLATLVDKPFDKPGWMYEVKWDGYRAIAFIENGNVQLSSRNSKSFNEKFYPLFQEMQSWKINAVIDGEIVSLNENGTADFSSLQGWRSEADGELVYYVFDILFYEEKNLMQLPLTERRNILKDILPRSENIKLSENFETNGLEFFNLAKEMSLEGIMAKKENSLYFPGARTKDWLKIKTQERQEVIIGGFTKNNFNNNGFVRPASI